MDLTSLPSDERRRLSLDVSGVEIRADESGAQRFQGYAAVFDSRTAIGNPLRWGFYEKIAPGAFTKTISEGDQRFLIDHDTYYVVSRVSAGTLKLAQDAKGMPVDSALDARLSYVGDLIANLDNRNITGMSFGFYVVKDDWTTESVETSDGQSAEVEVRRILEARVIEVSAVTFPAYEDTSAELASVARALVRRGDVGAIERRAVHRPELRDLLPLVDGERSQASDVPGVGREAEPGSSEDAPGAVPTREEFDTLKQELEKLQVAREPEQTTRVDDTDEPEHTTRRDVDKIDLAMRGLSARYGLTLPA